jgi:hypothetical protein
MKKIAFLLAGLLIVSLIEQAQIINKMPLSERITGYRMEVSLDTEAKIVSGSLVGFWVNKSGDTVPDIQMHLYMNAFRSNRTTFYNESGGSPGRKDSDLGWIKINSFTDRNNNDLLSLMNYISPDDGNTEDRSVIRVMLPKPVYPGDTVFVKMNFETKLPSVIRRTGFSNDFFFVAQWFPKFGVYESAGMRYSQKGNWNCHQFHANSEFYSDHSVYDVKITLPARYVIGSGGMLISETVVNESKKTVTYRAEDIVDFAWTAWPGYAVMTDNWKNVNITLLIPKERVFQAKRQFIAVKHALEYLNERVGPYPWPYLTFVDPPAIGDGSAGMEYTTLFTTESSLFMPTFFHMPEMVTVHEFGHAYFMGMLASNEFEEPWLDEGVNSFWEERIMDSYYGQNSGMLATPLLNLADKSYSRMGYVGFSGRQNVSNAEYSWNYPHETYGVMSYLKTATWLYTLMGLIGEKTMDDVFKEYYKKWAFRHPSGKDFTDVVNEVVKREHGDEFGPDMNWFFNETLYGTAVCDYKVSGIKNILYHKPEGMIEPADTMNKVKSADSLYTSIAQLERSGDLTLPVGVLVHFDNGDELHEKWDGKSRFKDFTYTGYRRIRWVKIDPDYKNRMDVNFINNSMTVVKDPIPVRRLKSKFTTFMQFFLNILMI